jgi:hypothetical protein
VSAFVTVGAEPTQQDAEVFQREQGCGSDGLVS